MRRPTLPSLALAAVAASSFACSKSDATPVSNSPEHAHHEGGHAGHEGGHAHHEGGHAHHEGGPNGHGYKGHRFDDPAEWTAHFESPERTAWQKPDEVVASLGLRPDMRIADLGAGTGYFAVRFAAVATAGKVYAVDIEPNMVAWLGERAQKEGLANLEAVQAEAEDPKLPGPVDLVFMCNVFHHLADAKAYFEAVAGELEPEGRVVIVDFRKDAPDDAPGPPAAMRMSADEIVAIMTSAGYQLSRRDEQLLEHQYLLEFTR